MTHYVRTLKSLKQVIQKSKHLNYFWPCLFYAVWHFDTFIEWHAAGKKNANSEIRSCLAIIICTCVCAAPSWPQLQSGGAGSEAEEAGGDVSVGGVPGKQVSLLSAYVNIQGGVRFKNVGWNTKHFLFIIVRLISGTTKRTARPKLKRRTRTVSCFFLSS